MRRVLLRIQASGEDHARDLLLDQKLDVFRLGHATLGLGAQDRGETTLGQPDAHDFGECRKDRVLQFGENEPDQPSPLSAELRWSLVAQHIEGGEHSLTGWLGDARLAVEHPADRGFADADLAGYFG